MHVSYRKFEPPWITMGTTSTHTRPNCQASSYDHRQAAMVLVISVVSCVRVISGTQAVISGNVMRLVNSGSHVVYMCLSFQAASLL
jgi:hypothetical protein